VVVGPFAMNILFDDPFTYGRWGLALVAIGMGFHLTAGTLNQAALARDRAGTAAACWLFTAAVVRGLHGQPAGRRRAAAGADRLLRGGRAAGRPARRGLPRYFRFFFRATYEWPFLTVTFLRLTKSRTWTTPRLTLIFVLRARVLREPLRAAHGRRRAAALGAEAPRDRRPTGCGRASSSSPADALPACAAQRGVELELRDRLPAPVCVILNWPL
jgi:hypothetical protein